VYASLYNELFGKAQRGKKKDQTEYLLSLMCEKLRAANKKIINLEKAYQKLKAKKISRKAAQKIALECAEELLDETQFEVVNSLFVNGPRRGRGRRYSHKLKVICLSIYLFDPRAYAYMRFILKALPCENTLRALLKQNKVEEGFLPFVFKALKCTSSDFDKLSKQVILSWDAINLSPELHYVDKGDEEGFVGGLDQETRKPATQANVLMIRGIFSDYKLPIAYFLHDPKLNAERVHSAVEEAIDKVNETGLVVKGLVCDQCPAHQSLYRNIFGVSAEKPFIERNGTKIFCFFDPPHLLKSVKANLRRSLLIFEDGGQEAIASWQHIIDFYLHDCTKITRVAPKLTDNHIFGKPVTNMNVPMTAHVLSRTVAAGIEEAVEGGHLDTEALPTAKICRLFNDLFDSCNDKKRRTEKLVKVQLFPMSGMRDFVPPADGGHNQTQEEDDDEEIITRRPLKMPVSRKSLHLKVWNEAEKMIKTMKFFRISTFERFFPPCLDGWLLTISAFKAMWKELQEAGCDKFPTGTINQDFVENFFSQVGNKIILL
jgi:hypothetical protein